MIKTNCKKCLFADFADSNNPCVMGIIEAIKTDKNIYTDSDNYNVIDKYRCAYGFNVDTYQQNQDKIGSVEDLKNALKQRAIINYYMIVFLDDDKTEDVCSEILALPIKPKFISLITYQNNETQKIIEIFKNKVGDGIGWKLHNMLEILDYQESLDVVLETNTHTKSSTYVWINSSDSVLYWKKDIENIHYIVTVKQPECHALVRQYPEQDGLFMAFQNYDEIRHSVNPDIFEALKTIPNPIIKNYA